MFQEYNASYAKDMLEDIATTPNSEKDTYTVKVDDGFKLPPLMLAFRFCSNPENPRLQEAVAKACIIKRQVKLFKNDVEIGTFVLNNAEDSFDAVPALTENPLAFSRLINSAQAFVLKKFTPSPRSTATPGQAAATETPPSTGA
jgi:hypothetical protein